MSQKYITAITRMRTVNIGNEALSSELVRVLRMLMPNKDVMVLERAPKHLTQYARRKLATAPDEAFVKIDHWAKQLSMLSPIENTADTDRSIKLVFELPSPKKILKVKEFLNLRQWAALVGVYKKEFQQRLDVFAKSETVILNPAGELNPVSIDQPLRMFTELLAAKKRAVKWE